MRFFTAPPFRESGKIMAQDLSNATDAEDNYRAAMNEMTMLMGCAPGSPESQRLSALTKIVQGLEASLPRKKA